MGTSYEVSGDVRYRLAMLIAESGEDAMCWAILRRVGGVEFVVDFRPLSSRVRLRDGERRQPMRARDIRSRIERQRDLLYEGE